MKKTLVSSILELDTLLSKKYGKDIKTDGFGPLLGFVKGIFKGKQFVISFEEDSLLHVSIENGGSELLKELTPFLKEVMGSEEPICGYDMLSNGIRGEENLHVIEWDIENPEERIKHVVNCKEYEDGTKISNIILFGNRNIESYIEDEKAESERIANTKIYGIYPGIISDVDKVKSISEVDLYFQINAMDFYVKHCSNEVSHDRMEKSVLIEAQYALEYLINQTRKFGVQIPEPKAYRHIELTPSYQSWFNLFNNHFKKMLSDTYRRPFFSLLKSGTLDEIDSGLIFLGICNAIGVFRARILLAHLYVELIKDSKVEYDYIGYVSYDAVNIANLVSNFLGKPGFLLKKDRDNKAYHCDIFGPLNEGDRIIMIDDANNSAKSLIDDINYLRNTFGVVIEDAFVFCKRTPEEEEKCLDNGIKLHCVTDMDELERLLTASSLVDPEVKQLVLEKYNQLFTSNLFVI